MRSCIGELVGVWGTVGVQLGHSIPDGSEGECAQFGRGA